jgi:hypothetical protein
MQVHLETPRRQICMRRGSEGGAGSVPALPWLDGYFKLLIYINFISVFMRKKSCGVRVSERFQGGAFGNPKMLVTSPGMTSRSSIKDCSAAVDDPSRIFHQEFPCHCQ